jgi:hypothetical protein
MLRIEPGTSGSAARNSDHLTTEADILHKSSDNDDDDDDGLILMITTTIINYGQKICYSCIYTLSDLSQLMKYLLYWQNEFNLHMVNPA